MGTHSFYSFNEFVIFYFADDELVNENVLKDMDKIFKLQCIKPELIQSINPFCKKVSSNCVPSKDFELNMETHKLYTKHVSGDNGEIHKKINKLCTENCDLLMEKNKVRTENSDLLMEKNELLIEKSKLRGFNKEIRGLQKETCGLQMETSGLRSETHRLRKESHENTEIIEIKEDEDSYKFVSKAQYPCKFCGKKYRWKSTKRRHEQLECGGKEPRFQCHMCSYKAKQKGNLFVHIRKHHKFPK